MFKTLIVTAGILLATLTPALATDADDWAVYAALRDAGINGMFVVQSDHSKTGTVEMYFGDGAGPTVTSSEAKMIVSQALHYTPDFQIDDPYKDNALLGWSDPAGTFHLLWHRPLCDASGPCTSLQKGRPGSID